jgi:hypothetical protein
VSKEGGTGIQTLVWTLGVGVGVGGGGGGAKNPTIVLGGVFCSLFYTILFLIFLYSVFYGWDK